MVDKVNESRPVLNREIIHSLFVKNENGTTLTENYIVLTLPIMLHVLYSFQLISLYQLIGLELKGNLIVNFLSVVVPFIVIFTTFNEFIFEIYFVVVLLSVLTGLTCLVLSFGSKYNPKFRLSIHLSQSTKIGFLFISRLRGLILISTAFAILAVDLTIFPKRFAKTDKYGLGTMDLGVGFFTIICGVVGGVKLHGTIILTILGIIRLVIVKITDYPVVDTEYGKHWNYFFTLAVVRIFGLIFTKLELNKKLFKLCILSFIIATLQHYILYFHEFETWVLDNSNGYQVSDNILLGFFKDNRQGLISSIGYINLWIFGTMLKLMMTCESSRNKWLGIIALWSFVGPVIIQNDLVPVSRCTANLGYLVWSTSSLTWQLLLLLVSDICINYLEDKSNFITKTHLPDVLSVANRFGLHYFLLANVLTGVVNKLFDTHSMDPARALSLLVVYCALPLSLIVLYNHAKHCPMLKCIKSC